MNSNGIPFLSLLLELNAPTAAVQSLDVCESVANGLFLIENDNVNDNSCWFQYEHLQFIVPSAGAGAAVAVANVLSFQR